MQKLGILTAAAVFAAGAHGAVAADVYEQGGSLKDAPIAVPPPIWTGFYVGAGVGAAMGFHDTDSAVLDTGLLDSTTLQLLSGGSDNGNSAILGTIQAGYDRQLGSRWVAGAFADYDWTSIDSDLGHTPINVIDLVDPLNDVRSRAKIDSSWTIGGRLGFLVTPSTLVYGLLGWTRAKLDLTSDLTVLNEVGGLLGTASASRDTHTDGVTFGAGIETMLRDNWFLKFEYRFTDLGGDKLSIPLLDTELNEAGVLDTHVDSEIHSVRAVLSYRLN
jgi:outer membrane immunogenic protein